MGRPHPGRLGGSDPCQQRWSDNQVRIAGTRVLQRLCREASKPGSTARSDLKALRPQGTRQASSSLLPRPLPSSFSFPPPFTRSFSTVHSFIFAFQAFCVFQYLSLTGIMWHKNPATQALWGWSYFDGVLQDTVKILILSEQLPSSHDQLPRSLLFKMSQSQSSLVAQ